MRKKIILLAAILAAIPGIASLPAQTGAIPDLDTFSKSFEDFSADFARSLPMNSTIGLNWSDAYIGQLLPIPSFGVGITTGFTTIPLGVLEDLVDNLGLDSGSALGDLPGIGVPLPGYALDARVGGLYLPFDAGIKFGTIPKIELSDVTVEYTNFGFDVRYAVLEGGLVLPKISVGAGYNYLQGRVTAPMGLGNTRVAAVPDPDGPAGNTDYSLMLTDPDISFDWSANVLDFKVQVSKRFLVVEPHIGLGASYGWAKTNAGFETSIEVRDSNGVVVEDVSPRELSGPAGVTIREDSISISAEENPFAIRAFGGASLNVAVFRLDLGAMYNLNSGAFGATLGARVQL